MEEVDNEALLTRLEAPDATAESVSAALATIPDAPRVVFVVDITDPPTPPRAILGDIEASGETADHAVLELGVAVAERIREVQAAEVATAEVDPEEQRRAMLAAARAAAREGAMPAEMPAERFDTSDAAATDSNTKVDEG